jgi:hypothetical protein
MRSGIATKATEINIVPESSQTNDPIEIDMTTFLNS